MEPNAADAYRHRNMASGVPVATPASMTLVTSIVLGVTIIATGFQLC